MDTTSNGDSEVVAICSDLIRIDTSNFGGDDEANERPAAEFVAQLLEDAGITATIYESEPGRANVVGRIEARIPAAPPCSSTATLTWFPPSPRTGPSIHSPARYTMAKCGGAGPSI